MSVCEPWHVGDSLKHTTFFLLSLQCFPTIWSLFCQGVLRMIVIQHHSCCSSIELHGWEASKLKLIGSLSVTQGTKVINASQNLCAQQVSCVSFSGSVSAAHVLTFYMNTVWERSFHFYSFWCHCPQSIPSTKCPLLLNSLSEFFCHLFSAAWSHM